MWVAWQYSRCPGTTPGSWSGSLARTVVSEDDIVSLPVHHCYVRATVGTERMPAFSMMVRKPEVGDPDRADRIRAASSSYVTTEEEMAAQQAEGRKRVEDFRKAYEAMKRGESPPQEQGNGERTGLPATRSPGTRAASTTGRPQKPMRAKRPTRSVRDEARRV